MEVNQSVNEGTDLTSQSAESPRPALERWFHVYPYLNRISEVEVSKVTDSSVVVDGRRRQRNTESEYYRPTLEEAKAVMIEHHEVLLGRAASIFAVRQRDLEQAREPQIKRLPTSEQKG
jgi:hypothetical protein